MFAHGLERLEGSAQAGNTRGPAVVLDQEGDVQLAPTVAARSLLLARYDAGRGGSRAV
jgi:hypothetical protein